MTTNLGVSSNKRFNTDSESDFDDNINSDEDINNENIQFLLVFLLLYTQLFSGAFNLALFILYDLRIHFNTIIPAL